MMEAFAYSYIQPDSVTTNHPHSRHATPQERNDAQVLRGALEYRTARFLAPLAEWSPARIMHALQVLEVTWPEEYEEGRAGVLVIALLAGELARLKDNVAAMATPHPADVCDDGETEAHGTAPL